MNAKAIFVFGVLRPDDPSGKAFALDFINRSAICRRARIKGASLFCRADDSAVVVDGDGTVDGFCVTYGPSEDFDRQLKIAEDAQQHLETARMQKVALLVDSCGNEIVGSTVKVLVHVAAKLPAASCIRVDSGDWLRRHEPDFCFRRDERGRLAMHESPKGSAWVQDGSLLQISTEKKATKCGHHVITKVSSTKRTSKPRVASGSYGAHGGARQRRGGRGQGTKQALTTRTNARKNRVRDTAAAALAPTIEMEAQKNTNCARRLRAMPDLLADATASKQGLASDALEMNSPDKAGKVTGLEKPVLERGISDVGQELIAQPGLVRQVSDEAKALLRHEGLIAATDEKTDEKTDDKTSAADAGVGDYPRPRNAPAYAEAKGSATADGTPASKKIDEKGVKQSEEAEAEPVCPHMSLPEMVADGSSYPPSGIKGMEDCLVPGCQDEKCMHAIGNWVCLKCLKVFSSSHMSYTKHFMETGHCLSSSMITLSVQCSKSAHCHDMPRFYRSAAICVNITNESYV